MARKILLADDSVTAQNMGRKILTDAGYEVITVNNGSAALKKIAEHKPDLIVLDVYMPGYSGLEVCQRVKENKETSRIPVLLTVGKLEPFKPEEARRVRADAFVIKPFEASELLSALTKLEDKIVPQAEPYKQGRFAKAAAAFDPEAEAGEKFGDTDGGWKARLRIPGASRKSRDAEPAVDYVATQGKGIRDLDGEAANKKSPPKSGEAPKQFERPMPGGLPQDITPEEIAAITAAAAQLNGAPGVAVPDAAVASVPQPAAEVPAAEAAAEESAPVTFASSPSLQGAEPQQGATEAEIPSVEAAQQPAPEPVALEAVAQETAPEPVAPPEVAATEASTSALAESASPAAAEDAKPEKISPIVEAKLEPPPAEEAEPQVVAATEAPTPEPVPSPEQSPVVEAAATEPAVPQAAAGAAPAEDEFMVALQSLMPANGNGTDTSEALKSRDDEMPPALAAIVAEVDSRLLVAHSAGPRWIAEEVALAASEATGSLQKEMEQAYAAYAAGEAFRAASSMTDVRGSVAIAEVAEPQVAEQPEVFAMAASAGEMGTAVAPMQPATEETSVVPSDEHQNQQEQVNEVTVAAADLEQPPPVVAETGAPVVASVEAVTETHIAGGTEEMANWKNIRDSIAGGAAAKPALAKEETREVEPPKPEPEPLAAAPATPPPSFGATDPRAIAAIVDSVLAELRPKIVEEIAKKLADPKKD